MLTSEQKIVLENAIYNIAKKYLTEKKDENAQKYKEREKTIINWVKSDTVNKAPIAYAIYNAKTDEEQASARSIFYKKLYNELNDNGVPYRFTPKELNMIDSELKKRKN